jgi:serine/threonine protein kinase
MTDLSDDAIERLQRVAGWPEQATDRYTILGELGRGGMGTVYAALDTELGREVALKISNVVSNALVERTVASEARVLASLEHPGIVPVHDAGRLVDGRPFYVMKRVVGRTLTQELRQPGNLGERLRVFERICETMAFAHARGILHRDLKPDNVMIGPFGEVMVLDWGVARVLEPAAGELSAPTTVYGTHGFMSPEQASGKTVDARTDVYALGAILRALASAAGEAIPKPLQSICAKAMAGPAGERYPSVAELRADVARFRASQAVAAHRESVVERAARFGRVYRTAILLVLAYIVMRALVAFSTRP